MHFDLSQSIEEPSLDAGYAIWSWKPSLLEEHADAKFESFRAELDSAVFPCLGDRASCTRLMREISSRAGFVAPATWLITFEAPGVEMENCATIQGLCEKDGIGSIQNVGVTPAHRGNGLGTVLLARAIEGFRKLGLRTASLEVTAENAGAIKLYQRVGFEIVRTVYKSVELPVAS